MNKKEALKILIEESLLFGDEEKERLISQIEIMSDEEIDSLGYALAIEMKTRIGDEDGKISDDN